MLEKERKSPHDLVKATTAEKLLETKGQPFQGSLMIASEKNEFARENPGKKLRKRGGFFGVDEKKIWRVSP